MRAIDFKEKNWAYDLTRILMKLSHDTLLCDEDKSHLQVFNNSSQCCHPLGTVSITGGIVHCQHTTHMFLHL